jgi:energy-coupling factor transport system ATP-binding protein
MRIEIASLSHTYPTGVTALREVSLQVDTGESVAIVGQNGAGKTTLVKHLNGLLRPTTGVVTVGGLDTRAHSTAQLAARVGYLFQNPDEQLFKQTVRQEVEFGPKNLGWPAERVEAQTAVALLTTGLDDVAARHPYDLSPGERKRVALASVLAMDTPIVVLDEPTTGEDINGVEVAGRIVDGLRAAGRTVIAVSHDIDFCAEHFERTIVMAEGRVLLDGPSRDVLGQAEVLAQSLVEPPQLVRLARRLGLPGTPLTTPELLQSWKNTYS